MTNNIHDLPLADDLIGGETNGDRIRRMSDDELSGLLQAAYYAGQDDLAEYLQHNTYGERFIWTEEWFSQPSEGE